MKFTLVVLACLAFSACKRGDLPKELSRGEHVDYFHDADHAPCADVIGRIDRFVDDLDSTFGLELPPDFRFEYYHLETAEDGDERLAEICGSASACTFEYGVFTPEWAHLHEVLHATLMPSGSAPPLFNEGLAHLVDCGPHRFIGSTTSRETPLERVISRETWDSVAGDTDPNLRQSAASFTRFVIEESSPRAFGAFLRESKRTDDEAAVRALFQAHFDRDIDDAFADWRASDLPIERGERCFFFEDACDDVPLVSELASVESRDTAGSCLPEVVVVDSPASTAIDVRTSSATPGWFATVTPCDQFANDNPVIRTFSYLDTITPDTETRFSSWIPPGRWAIAVNPGHRRTSDSVSIEVELVPRANGCAAASSVVLDEDHPSFTVAGVSDDLLLSNVWNLSVDETTRISTAVFGPLTWGVCAASCPLTDCRSVRDAPLEPGDYKLVLQMTTPQSGLAVWGSLLVIE